MTQCQRRSQAQCLLAGKRACTVHMYYEKGRDKNDVRNITKGYDRSNEGKG